MCRPLLELLAEMPDPRGRHGRQYPLAALLGLTLVAVLAGQTSLAAIAQFGRLRGHRLGHALGFRSGRMPCANTLAKLLRDLDADRLDATIGEWLAGRHGGGWEHVAIDGKVLRGSRDGAAPGVHRLAAYAPQAASVIAQMAVESTTNEHKAALRLLGALPPLRGAVVTADAAFPHADFAAGVLGRQGEYILYAKANRPGLRDDIAAAFDAAEGGDFSPPAAAGLGPGRRGGLDAGRGPRAGRGPDAGDLDLAR